jgi:hypothetical protein
MANVGNSMSQFIARIDIALSKVTNAHDQAELLARKGCYFSRIGRFDEARQIVSFLRSGFGLGQSITITIWIMLLEGILFLYTEINSAASDRVMRAQFLSIAAKDRELIAITSAWKAHLEFESSEFDKMIDSLTMAAENLSVENHDAQCRFSMVLCNSLYLCGDRDRAQFWFTRARLHAVASGDQATTEALLYNRSAFGMAWLRAQACISQVDQKDVDWVRREMASARNFQDMTGVLAFGHLIGLCEARVSLMAGSYEKAIEQLSASRLEGPFANYNFDQKFIDLELAYCYVNLNKIDSAKALISDSEFADFSLLDLDEQLVASYFRYQLSVLSSYFGSSDTCFKNLEILREKYRSHRTAIHGKLVSFHEHASKLP